jgi:hypothetical protein
MPTATRRLEDGNDVTIDPQLDVLLNRRFLRSALAPVAFDSGLIKVGRKNVFCMARPGKILMRPFRIFRIGLDAAVDEGIFGFCGWYYSYLIFLTEQIFSTRPRQES